MRFLRAIHRWVQKPDYSVDRWDYCRASGPDPIGDALFRMNKALLVYLLLPFILIMLIVWIV